MLALFSRRVRYFGTKNNLPDNFDPRKSKYSGLRENENL